MTDNAQDRPLFDDLEQAFFAAGDTAGHATGRTDSPPRPDALGADAEPDLVYVCEREPAESGAARRWLHARLLQLSWVRVWVTARVIWPAKLSAAALASKLVAPLSAASSALRGRLRPRLRLLRFRIGLGARLLGDALFAGLPTRLERQPGGRFTGSVAGTVGDRLVRPFLIWSGEQLPRLRNRRPGLVLAAAFVLVSTMGTLWAAVVVAATHGH